MVDPTTRQVHMAELEFNALARAVRDIVAQHSALADVIVRKQAEYLGLSVSTLSVDDLPALSERVGRSVGMFTNPAKGAAVREAIRVLSSEF